MELARKALMHIGVENKELKTILGTYRQNYNAQMEEVHGVGQKLNKIIKMEKEE